jgi:hypothetical protein
VDLAFCCGVVLATQFSSSMPLSRFQLTPSQEFLASSNSTKVASQLFTNYHRNVAYNLDAVKKMPKPV